MPSIFIQVRGLEAAIRVNRRLMTWKVGLHRPLGELLKRQHEHRINEEKKSPKGRQWQKLAASTIAKKTSRGNTDPENILKDTSAMSQSFRINIQGDLIRLSNPSAVTIFHQEGTRYMVARPFMGLSNPNVTEIRRMVTRHIQAKFERIR